MPSGQFPSLAEFFVSIVVFVYQVCLSVVLVVLADRAGVWSLHWYNGVITGIALEPLCVLSVLGYKWYVERTKQIKL